MCHFQCLWAQSYNNCHLYTPPYYYARSQLPLARIRLWSEYGIRVSLKLFRYSWITKKTDSQSLTFSISLSVIAIPSSPHLSTYYYINMTIWLFSGMIYGPPVYLPTYEGHDHRCKTLAHTIIRLHRIKHISKWKGTIDTDSLLRSVKLYTDGTQSRCAKYVSLVNSESGGCVIPSHIYPMALFYIPSPLSSSSHQHLSCHSYQSLS